MLISLGLGLVGLDAQAHPLFPVHIVFKQEFGGKVRGIDGGHNADEQSHGKAPDGSGAEIKQHKPRQCGGDIGVDNSPKGVLKAVFHRLEIALPPFARLPRFGRTPPGYARRR